MTMGSTNFIHLYFYIINEIFRLSLKNKKQKKNEIKF